MQRFNLNQNSRWRKFLPFDFWMPITKSIWKRRLYCFE